MELDNTLICNNTVADIISRAYKVSELQLRQSYSDRFDWEHLDNSPGVYLIINLLNGRAYLGASSNIRKRVSSHINRLKKGVHKRSNMQSEFNQDTFGYLVVEYTEFYESREVYWWEYFKDNTYNIRPSPETGKNVFPSKESVAKIAKGVSKALKGVTPKNIDLVRERQRRPILEFEDGEFVREYDSCRQAGFILNVCYKRINRILTRGQRGQAVHPLREYPNKIWVYKDNKPVRVIQRN